MNVLIVGGSGYVGGMIIPYLRERHRVRTFDLVASEESTTDFVQGSVTDPEALEAAMEGMEMEGVIYLAMGRNVPGVGFPVDESYDVNVKGVHRALEAAVKVGVRRAVYASTLSVYHETGRYLESEDVPPDAKTIYGFTKRLGEEVCRFFAEAYGLSVIALRLETPTPIERWRELCRSGRVMTETASTDVARAFHLALTCEHSGFDAIFISADYLGKTMSLAKARRILGWEPLERCPM